MVNLLGKKYLLLFQNLQNTTTISKFIVAAGVPTNPQIDVEEDDMLTQQRRNFEADQAKGDGHVVRTTFFDYDFSQKKSATKSGKNASLWRRILSCHHKNQKQSGTAALLEVQAKYCVPRC